MVEVSVCIEMVYDDEPFHERIHRAADAEADAIEFWDWREKDLDAIETAASDAGIPIVGCTAGGVLTDPDEADAAVETIRESIETATDLGCSTLIVTTGPDQDEMDRETQHENIVDILSRVAPDAENAGVTLTVEPLNTAIDHPGYYLRTASEGFAIVDEVGSANVKLLYDVYHQQVTEGNIIATITDNVEKIGHIHVADVPGRHEPGTGELNYENVLEAIDETSYDGYVGCEFSPTGDPDEAMASIVNQN
jgi:hydroxypyruvate isomerase